MARWKRTGWSDSLLVHALVLAGFVALWAGSAILIISPELAAAHGRGVRGTFTAEEPDCGWPCRWDGTFRSDDGQVVYTGVWIYGYRRNGLAQGRRVPALAPDSGFPKVYRPGTSDLLGAGLWVGLIGMLPVLVGMTLMRRLRSSRRTR